MKDGPQIVRKHRHGQLALFTSFLLLLGWVVYILATKSLPLWSFVLISTLLGTTISLSLLYAGSSRMCRLARLQLAIMALIVWSYHAIATNFNLIAFYDSYQEFTHLRIILDRGSVEVGRLYSNLYVGPGFATSYPLYSILAASFALLTGLPLLSVATGFPLVTGVFLFLNVFLFLRYVLRRFRYGSLGVTLGLLAFVVSTDMTYTSTVFYHRGIGLGFGFLALYLLVRYSNGDLDTGHRLILIFALGVLPLAHSAYGAIYTVYAVLFAVLVWAAHLLASTRRERSPSHRLRSTSVPALLIVLIGFLWNFLLLFPSPLSQAFASYTQNLLFPDYEVGDIARFQSQAEPFFPSAVRPEPWIILLPLRDIFVYGPIIVVGLYLIVRVLTRKSSKMELVLLLGLLAFAPMVYADFLAGWAALQFRYYAFPFVAYSMARLYGASIRRGTAAKILSLSIITFLIGMALASPLSHIYYPRQLYDPTIDGRDIGFPSPSYVAFGRFVEQHPFGDGLVLSDFSGLLGATLPLEYSSKIRPLVDFYGTEDTYIVEFVQLRPTLGYHSPGTVEAMNEIRASVDSEYSKVVDAGVYTIYTNS